MLTDYKILRIKNIVLIFLAAVCFAVCKLTQQSLPCDASVWNTPSVYIRNITNFFKENFVYLLGFFLFITIALTSMLLGYLIYRRFDRNRSAGTMCVNIGELFFMLGIYFLMSSRALFIFPSERENVGFVSALCIFFLPQLFLAYAARLHAQKWIRILEWVFAAYTATFLLLGMLPPIPAEVYHMMIYVNHILTFGVMTACIFLNNRDRLVRKNDTRVVHATLGFLEFVLYAVAAVCYAFSLELWYFWILFAAGAVMSFLMLSGQLDMAARQYIKTSDYENVKKMAYIDGLCNIQNRNAFLMEQEQTFHSDSLYYVVFDLNNLKRINDRFGHSEGDNVIRKAAEIISQSFLEIGKCFRIGGDEFVVMGQYHTLEEIQSALRKMNTRIRRYNRETEAKLDVAYGYALRDSTDINTYELFNKADKAMYKYKRRGKAVALRA